MSRARTTTSRGCADRDSTPAGRNAMSAADAATMVVAVRRIRQERWINATSSSNQHAGRIHHDESGDKTGRHGTGRQVLSERLLARHLLENLKDNLRDRPDPDPEKHQCPDLRVREGTDPRT